MLIKVNKPIDGTSNDVVQFIKHFFHFKKVGHAGTLDPKATGLLILGTNEDTSRLNSLLRHNKTYKVKMRLHEFSSSYDLDSDQIHFYANEKMISSQEINAALIYFQNLEYGQEPPMFSAIKVNGQKAYELARKNIQIQLPKKRVFIYDLHNVNFDEKTQELNFTIHVSSGFYIRSLVRDLANFLHVHAILISLNRIQIDQYNLTNALDVIQLKQKRNLTAKQKEEMLMIASVQ